MRDTSYAVSFIFEARLWVEQKHAIGRTETNATIVQQLARTDVETADGQPIISLELERLL